MIEAILKYAPQSLILGALGLLVLLVLGVPLALKVAGLTGQQIIDLLTLTMQFFINLAREFKEQNKQG